jgi:iron-sulfur cluster assembly protein
MDEMTIRLTDAAVARMREFLARPGDAVAVRFGVKRTGCSGYSYTVDLTDSIAAGDVAFEQDGVKVVVHTTALPLVDGTEIDFRKQGLNSGFVFSNPKVTGECGCGESFTIAGVA